jgi:(R,R)-butanediol dehydrogenase/meso-butanediol dehydrogenase/diacetyl reductase/L-iditol 2-dehydrogenase
MMPLLLKLAKRGGTIVYGAMYPLTYDMPLNLAEYLYRKELTITGVLIAPYAFPRAVQTLARLDLNAFTECVYPLDQAHEAMVMTVAGKYPKVLVECTPGLE